MSGHTPGPWRVTKLIKRNPEEEDNDYPGAEISFLEVEDDGRTHEHTGAIQVWSERAEANARLIAAAPDLLVGCRRLLLTHGCGFTDENCGDCRDLRAVIAKAEGR